MKVPRKYENNSGDDAYSLEVMPWIKFYDFFLVPALTCDTLWASWRLPSWPCTWWLYPLRKPKLIATRVLDTIGLTMGRLTGSIEEASNLPFCRRRVVSANDQTHLYHRKLYSTNVSVMTWILSLYLSYFLFPTFLFFADLIYTNFLAIHLLD